MGIEKRLFLHYSYKMIHSQIDESGALSAILYLHKPIKDKKIYPRYSKHRGRILSLRINLLQLLYDFFSTVLIKFHIQSALRLMLTSLN